MSAVKKARPIVGWREWVVLPDLGVRRIKAKVDTGARTSALHAFEIEPFRRGRVDWVRFEIHPVQRSQRKTVRAQARVLDTREVRSSSGQTQRRYVIETDLKIGEHLFPIELTLTNRDQMGFRMLLGRAAIRGRFMVDPGRSYLVGQGPPST